MRLLPIASALQCVDGSRSPFVVKNTCPTASAPSPLPPALPSPSNSPLRPLQLLTLTLVSWIAVITGCAKKLPQTETALPAQISFNEHVRPIFTQHCTACHGGVKNAGGVSFIYQKTALGKSQSGKSIIVPGSPAQSEVIRRITSSIPEERMPPAAHGEPLAPREIAILKTWINQGATWEEHWAYQAPVAPAIPSPADSDWAANEIDQFVLAAMESHDLSPNPEASKARLLRRLALDLTGLPPSLAEVRRFEADDSLTAYAAEVDRLLASRSFGERWASPWLDLARYADTKGYERDSSRDIWGYRDWVIRALNEDMPFDEFTIKQIAGDLQPNPSFDDLVATAFHRNSKTNVEGGTDDEEYRVAAVMDRVSTTWQTWMGTTFSCVQCHSHPYDPFPHESYYEFLAYFDNSMDHNLGDEYPTINYAIDPAERESAFSLQKEIRALRTAYVEPFQALSQSSEWTPLTYLSATSTQGVVFSIERDALGTEILQTGPNAPKGTVHTIIAQRPGASVQALRIDAPMLDKTSVEKPGDPFTLSHFEAFLQDAGGAETPIDFERIISDDANPRLWPELSLVAKNSSGWSTYPKQHYPRWAVFIPSAPLEIPSGSTLKFVIHNQAGHDGGQQPVMRRFHFSASNDPSWPPLSQSDAIAHNAARRETLTAQLDEMDLSSVPVMAERRPDYARISNVFVRGDWLERDEQVFPAIPALLKSKTVPAPSNRLELARWIVAPDNPLTARFTANRIWAQLMGRGIVETIEDFGTPGTPPTHPELLDHLALQFRGPLQWSRKALIREIVLTSTYRQSAKVVPAHAAIDPRNTWLSRAPQKRLTAEMTRDNALKISGLLTSKMYGPPVMPPQPDGVWRTVYNDDQWINAENDDRYRRAIYTYWKRSNPYPSFITFDALSRDTCVPRRIETNTPLQALVTLNDPVYFECAANLARLAMNNGSDSPAEWIKTAYAEALLTDISPADLESLLKLYKTFVAEPDNTPESALTYVNNAILNLDAFLTR